MFPQIAGNTEGNKIQMRENEKKKKIFYIIYYIHYFINK